MEQVIFQDLGKIKYKEAWDYQEALFRNGIETKRHNKHSPDEPPRPVHHYLLFCEHEPVYTLGKSGHLENLLVDQQQLDKYGIGFYKIDRGGDITYHGPGQVVGYPILDLSFFFKDIGRYMRTLEEIIIRTLAEYGLKGDRLPGSTGVWLDPNIPGKARKICAMGVRCSRWITMHGFALNVNANLEHFNHIIPCGIGDKAVTSMEKEMERQIPLAEVKAKLKKHFETLFACRLKEAQISI